MAIEPNEAVKTPDELVDLMRTQNATFLENQRRRHDEAMALMADLKSAIEGRIAELTAENDRLRASEQSAALRGAERMREAAASLAKAHGDGRTAAKLAADQKKERQAARDFESMAIEASHIMVAIRQLDAESLVGDRT